MADVESTGDAETAMGSQRIGPFARCAETEADLAAAVATYAEESLPGCFGSIDCTHIGWVRARAAVHSWFVGKEGVPTVAFQVIVDHTTKVAHCCFVFSTPSRSQFRR